MGKTYIADTCDVTMTRLSDRKTIFTASASVASISSSIEEEQIKGGIGSKTQFILKSDKEVELSVTDVLFDKDYLELTQGMSFKEDTIIVTNKEDSLLVDSGKITINGTPADDKATIINQDGVMKEVAVEVGGSITVEPDFAKDGENLTAIFKETVTGQVLSIDADKFPENYEIEYRTIEYSRITNEVVRDIYFLFYNASPTGELDLSFENGEPIAPEIGFTCLAAPNTSNIGKIVQVDRK